MPDDPKPNAVTLPTDSDRGNNPSEPADPGELAEGLAEPVHETHNFPAGGGPSGAKLFATPPATPAGSTGRNATDTGRTDSEGVPGAGSAGSAGG